MRTNRTKLTKKKSMKIAKSNKLCRDKSCPFYQSRVRMSMKYYGSPDDLEVENEHVS